MLGMVVGTNLALILANSYLAMFEEFIDDSFGIVVSTNGKLILLFAEFNNLTNLLPLTNRALFQTRWKRESVHLQK